MSTAISPSPPAVEKAIQMRKLLLAGFAVATVAILVAAAAVDGSASAAGPSAAPAPATTRTVGPPSIQHQVFGELADRGPPSR